MNYKHVFLGLLLFACKPQSQVASDTASLDNFAGGEHTQNVCSGNFPLVAQDAQITADPQHVTDIKTALTALPPNLQEEFFGKGSYPGLNGRIVVTPDIAKSCKVSLTPFAEQGKGMISCWQAVSNDQAIIFIKQGKDAQETRANIQHATVRAFGYLLAQVVVKSDGNEYLAMKKELAHRLVGSVALSNGKYSLAAFGDFLPPSVLADDLSVQDRRAALEAVADQEKSLHFFDYALAEAIDSWYCSHDTRKKLATDFTSEHELIDVGRMTADIAAQLEGKATAHNNGDALALWGRWGAGNGPLRQGFGNWRSFRQGGGGLFNFRRASQGGGWIFNRL